MKKKEIWNLMKLAFVAIIAMMAISVTSCGKDDDEEPSNSYTENDFFGYWIDGDGTTVFELKSSSALMAYKLEKFGSLHYTDTFSGRWRYSELTNELVFYWDGSYPQSEVTSEGLTNSFSVKNCTPHEITLIDAYGYTIVIEDHNGNLSPMNNDDNRIIGKWKGTDYDETYTLKFNNDGTMTEIWSDGYNTETCTVSFTFQDGKLDFPDDFPIFINVIGYPPLNVKFSSEDYNRTMTISKGSTSMKFTRQ